MHFSVFKFFVNSTSMEEFKDKNVLDIGSYDVNGTLRSIIQPTMFVKSYLGTDMRDGPSVNMNISSEELLGEFGLDAFDIIICTEMLEHALEWKWTINNIKYLLRPNGILFLTTRSEGFPLHSYPEDFWRFSLEDMKYIFADMTIEKLESDPQDPGVFVKVIKPANWKFTDNLNTYDVYSMKEVI